MKTLSELNAYKEKAAKQMGTKGGSVTKVLVGLATCGIAAGGKPVYEAFNEAVAAEGAKNTEVGQTGCIGVCQFEPVAEVFTPDGKRYTYVKLDAEKVGRIVKEHLVGGKPVLEYTIGANQ